MGGGDRLSRKRIPVLFNRDGLYVFISRMAGNIKGQESPHVSKYTTYERLENLSESQVWIPLESLAAASIAMHCAYPHRTVSTPLPAQPQRLLMPGAGDTTSVTDFESSGFAGSGTGQEPAKP